MKHNTYIDTQDPMVAIVAADGGFEGAAPGDTMVVFQGAATPSPTQPFVQA